MEAREAGQLTLAALHFRWSNGAARQARTDKS